MLQCIINTLVDEFIAAHIIFRCYLVDKLQLILRNPYRDRILLVLLRNKICHKSHLLYYRILYCILKIDSYLNLNNEYKGDCMNTYKQLYAFLVGNQSDALDLLADGRVIEAILLLQKGLLAAEEIHLETDMIPEE